MVGGFYAEQKTKVQNQQEWFKNLSDKDLEQAKKDLETIQEKIGEAEKTISILENDIERTQGKLDILKNKSDKTIQIRAKEINQLTTELELHNQSLEFARTESQKFIEEMKEQQKLIGKIENNLDFKNKLRVLKPFVDRYLEAFTHLQETDKELQKQLRKVGMDGHYQMIRSGQLTANL